MYNAIDIANYCIWYYSCELKVFISNLKLQKVLYFLQAEFLVSTGKPLFKEKLIAWDFGAIVKEVYDKFKIYGSSSIYFSKNSEISKSRFKIRNKDKEIINEVLKELKSYSSFELTEINLSQTPWINAYYKRYGKIFSDIEIDLNELKEFFMED